MHLHLVLGNQLFEPKKYLNKIKPGEQSVVFMREDLELCTYFRFHKQKIYLFLAAMRAYRDELSNCGYRVHYESLDSSSPATDRSVSYEAALLIFIETKKPKLISVFEIEDKFFETRIHEALRKSNVSFEVWETPMFMTSRKEFQLYLKRYPKPFMKTFYERQRKRLKIMVDKNDEPLGGRWSFDEENRKLLPATVIPPSLPTVSARSICSDVANLCIKRFKDHPGELKDFWMPVTRDDATHWLQSFLEERLENFGPFEDALPKHSDFVFHSVLTPMLNLGLLSPEEVIDTTLRFAKRQSKQIPIESLEGFVRQVIGWREFIRGVYQNFSESQENSNFFNHERKLSVVWYGSVKSGIPPLDRALSKVFRYGYAHHIERLMVFGSLMVLLEIAPKEAYRWFMEMFIDSSDWVMGPNVFGMALFSDGGVFATKPYICGSNYYRKMSGDKAGDWCDGLDGLYWSFVERHIDFFTRNPRLSMITRNLQKIPAARKDKIYAAANNLRELLTERA